MPELPEVETVRRQLVLQVVGRKIGEVKVWRRDIIRYPSASQFLSAIKGKVIVSLNRRGKYLIFRLGSKKLLVIHLGMSGHLRFTRDNTKMRFERLRFRLNRDRALVMDDSRVLGRVYLGTPEEIKEVVKGLARLGREPIDSGFTKDYLYPLLQKRKAKIKSVLLDQRVCAGVGNIYSDEALFRAGILPNRPANSLSYQEVERLAKALRAVLQEGIEHLGTTMEDERYLLPDGNRGGFQKFLRVFSREGEVCRRRQCGGTILRTRIGNRSSYYCPRCQK